MPIFFRNQHNPQEQAEIRLERNCVIQNIDPKKSNKPSNELSFALSTGQTRDVSLPKTQYKLLEALASANDRDQDDDIDVLTIRDLIHAKERFKTPTDVFRELGVKEFRCDATAGIANITTNNGDVLRIEFELNSKPSNQAKSQKTSPVIEQTKSKTITSSSNKKQVAEKGKTKQASTKTNSTLNKQKINNTSKKNKTISTTTKDTNAFLLALANRESDGDYTIINKYGFVGAYQVGEEALHDVGVYYETKKTGINYKKNDWKGYISDKNPYGITCLSDFLYSPSKQKAVQIDFKKKHWQYLKDLNLTQYIGRTIKGIRITPSGLLAGAHLVGPGGVKNFLSSNGKNDVTDANGTKVSSYIKKFAGYDIREITST